MDWAPLAMLAISIASVALTAFAMSWLIRVRRRPSEAGALGAVLGLLTPIPLYAAFLSLSRGSEMSGIVDGLLLIALLPLHIFVQPIGAIVYASRRRDG